MKKIFLSLFGLIFTINHPAKAEEDDFFDNLIVDEQMKQKVEQTIEMEESQTKASEILDRQPLKLEIGENAKINLRETKNEDIVPVPPREPAPFGLKWLATTDEIKYMKILLRPKQVKDSPNSYIAENLPKPVKAFKEVLLSFGETDALWRIAGYGKEMEDDSKATKGLEEYKKFYDILNEKYGNAQEFYTPAVINIDEEIVSEDGVKTHNIKQKILEMGEEGFKQKLMSGESTLYATFENDHIGVTLALLANGDGKTFIVIDYKNLKINEVEQQEIFDAL
ncbi:MAG: hypothetical protein IJ870_03330 [Alphaproteobacteria bacterium]|nr:hypothetical protein [Alphaproteobacteria bacterium]